MVVVVGCLCRQMEEDEASLRSSVEALPIITAVFCFFAIAPRQLARTLAEVAAHYQHDVRWLNCETNQQHRKLQMSRQQLQDRFL